MCCFADLCLLRRSTPSTSSGYPEHISRKGVPEVTSSWLVPKEEVKEEYMTSSQINDTFLFHRVLKILMGGRILQISIARCQIDGEIHSFPTMYGKGG